MGSFISNSQAYNIKSENELAAILSNFETEYVLSIMQDNISKALTTFDPIPKPNVVNAFEANFKAILTQYPEDKAQTNNVRTETYLEIIDSIAKSFNFSFKTSSEIDTYSSASFLYDFFVSNIDIYIISFLSDFIIKEQDQIYKSLNLDQFKKDKDVTTLYNKRVYSNPAIAIMCSHMDLVLKYILGFNFDFDYILNFIYNNNIGIMSIFQNVVMDYDFYKQIYGGIISNPNIFPLINTYIKIDIQRKTAPTDSPINLNF